MVKIQKVSTYLIWVFNGALIVYPLLNFSQWFFAGWEPINLLMGQGVLSNGISTPERVVNLTELHLTPLSRTIGLGGSLIGFLPLFWGLIILKQLFKNYREGDVFTAINARKYKTLGWLCVIGGFITLPLSNMLMVLSATLSNPPGHRYISINFGTPNLEVILVGAIIILISWIMTEGFKLQEEKNFTI